MKEVRIGDRFKWYRSDGYWVIYEYFDLLFNAIVVDAMDKALLGHKFNWYPNEDDKYLGNFAKANHFETLYNLLNG